MKTITVEQMKFYYFIGEMKKYNEMKTISSENYQVEKYAKNVDMTAFIKNINYINSDIYKKYCI